MKIWSEWLSSAWRQNSWRSKDDADKRVNSHLFLSSVHSLTHQTQWCVRHTYIQGGNFCCQDACSVLSPQLPASWRLTSDMDRSSFLLRSCLNPDRQELSRGGIILVEDNKDLKLTGISDSWCRRIICILSIVYFNKTLIDQAGSIGGSTRQEVEMGRWEQEYSGKQDAPSAIPAQTTEDTTCELTAEKGTKPYG